MGHMTNTQTTQISPLPDYQPIHRSKLGVRFICKDCHDMVMWKESLKTGKTYLAIADCAIRNDDGRVIKVIYPGHKCVPTLEAQQRFLDSKAFHANANAVAIASGEIVKGQTVEVFKGRKIAKGTTGLVFWVAPQPDHFDTIKVGFTTADGEKIFINIEHLMVKAVA